MSDTLNLLFSLGRPFSPFYSLAMKAREKLYGMGALRKKNLDVPVISIGNLTLGGTGKSPTVAHIGRLLANHGYRPAIVSRGYGGRARDRVNIISDGNALLLSPDLAGDEPYMLAQALPDVPVLTGVRRFYPASQAVTLFNANVILLDDGFQHLALARDVDVVLFDGTTLAGNSRIFPGGPLREPVSALNRCHAFVITGVTDANRQRVEHFKKLLHQRFADKPVHYSSIGSTQLIQADGNVAAVDQGAKCFGFCGIANPERFRDTLIASGISMANFLSLRDHVVYNQALLATLSKKAAKDGAKYLVTTEKDYVKIKHLHCDLPLHRLRVHSRIDKSFDQYILARLKEMR